MKSIAKSLLNRLPYVRGLYKQTALTNKNSFYPAGHYYSPIASVDDLRQREGEIWKNAGVDGIKGIELNTDSQIDLTVQFSQYYSDLPFSRKKDGKLRYWFENDFYSYTDGTVLYSMMRHFKPKRIIEVGSGYSSALMMDVNELFFQNSIRLDFIEPFPGRLYSLMSAEDKRQSVVWEKPVQTIDPVFFGQLQPGDILFIDSSHVAKCGSDVNYIFSEVLPSLNKGVLVHFHDVFYPFEYPKEWVLSGWNWNEDYLLKAFLMYNREFSIRIFSNYLHIHHKDAFKDMPLTYLNTGGNFWMEKN
jgi:predicted O-methyltransferase YrrM